MNIKALFFYCFLMSNAIVVHAQDFPLMGDRPPLYTCAVEFSDTSGKQHELVLTQIAGRGLGFHAYIIDSNETLLAKFRVTRHVTDFYDQYGFRHYIYIQNGWFGLGYSLEVDVTVNSRTEVERVVLREIGQASLIADNWSVRTKRTMKCERQITNGM